MPAGGPGPQTAQALGGRAGGGGSSGSGSLCSCSGGSGKMAARAGFQSVAPSGGAGASGGAGVAAALGPGGTPGPPVRMGPAPGQGLYRSPMPGAAYPVSGTGGGARGPGAGPSEGGGLTGVREKWEGLPREGLGPGVEVGEAERRKSWGKEVSILTCSQRHCFRVRSECGTRVGEVGPGMGMGCRGEWAAPVSPGTPKLLQQIEVSLRGDSS